MNNKQVLAIFALVAALGIVSVVAIDINAMLTMQEAEAVGCKNSVAFEASKGRCFRS